MGNIQFFPHMDPTGKNNIRWKEHRITYFPGSDILTRDASPTSKNGIYWEFVSKLCEILHIQKLCTKASNICVSAVQLGQFD